MPSASIFNPILTCLNVNWLGVFCEHTPSYLTLLTLPSVIGDFNKLSFLHWCCSKEHECTTTDDLFSCRQARTHTIMIVRSKMLHFRVSSIVFVIAAMQRERERRASLSSIPSSRAADVRLLLIRKHSERHYKIKFFPLFLSLSLNGDCSYRFFFLLSIVGIYQRAWSFPRIPDWNATAFIRKRIF